MTGKIDLEHQQYINIETFRKSGLGVKTPVWFVLDGDIILVRTIANSGKVKRIRNNSQVKIAACKVDGTPVSEWVQANAREVVDPEVHRKVDRLLDKKYGLMKKMFSLASTIQGRKYTVLEIKVKE